MEGRNRERQIGGLIRLGAKDKTEEGNLVGNIMRGINRRGCRGEGDVRSHGTVELERCQGAGAMGRLVLQLQAEQELVTGNYVSSTHWELI